MSPWLYLFFLCVPPLATGLMEEVYIGAKVLKSISDIWKSKDDGHNYQQQLQEKVVIIPNQLSAAEDMKSKVELLEIINRIPNHVKDEMQMNQLLEAMDQIERVEATFEDYQKAGLLDQFILKNKLKKVEDIIMKFLDSIISNDHQSVQVNMENIHQLVAGNKKISALRSDFFSRFLEYLKKTDESLCKVKMSSHQLLSSLFSMLQMAQLKGYSMMQFSWLMLNLHSKGNLTGVAEGIRTTFKKRLFLQAIAFINTITGADRSLWRCDPEIHKEGTTYTQLTKVLQGIFSNEMDLNDEKSCSKDCSSYSSTEQSNQNKSLPKKSTCDGDLDDCQSVDSEIQLCDAPDHSPRRYGLVKFKNLTLGSEMFCKNNITKLPSYKWHIFRKCSLCYCHCDEPKNIYSVRYFNLRATMSDTANNKVVTGVRFFKRNLIIHLQIQEGQLLPFGRINVSTIGWKPVERYNITVKNLTKNIDYHRLTMEERALNLSDVKWPYKNRVVTGVKFDVVEKQLNLRVAFSAFSFEEGKLLLPVDYRFEPKYIFSPKYKSELSWKKRGIPTMTAGFSRIDSSINQFVKFGPTDLESDAGQTTVPFLDIQEVAPYPPVPLGGIGLYHKGREGSVGFIGPRVYTFDFSEQIIADFKLFK